MPTTLRRLLITADDFGIGPETSRGILDLGAQGAVTSTVLLVNSPFAEEGVAQWRARGCPVELGWHPCLTLDAPIAAAESVPSLVDADRRFHPLGTLLKKLFFKRIQREHLERELRAQHRRFCDLVGHEPRNINGHHHVHIFRPVANIIADIARSQRETPHVRRVTERWRTLMRVKGARRKRAFLSHCGRWNAQDLPGTGELLGITDPPFVHEESFFMRWLSQSRAATVELTCHPGHLDATLVGRDGSFADGQLHRRAAEFKRLGDTSFLKMVKSLGLITTTAAALVDGETVQITSSRRAG
jgi:predicted glycoside hydrolase/deacetylase ChbG (UPF0249 family)